MLNLTLEDRKATTEKTALNVFINGIKSDVGTMTRVHSFKLLSDAGNFAIRKERNRNILPDDDGGIETILSLLPNRVSPS